MPRRRKEDSPYSDMFMKLAQYILEKKESGNLSLTSILQELINAALEAERQLYLQQHPDNSANGFYDRNLYLTMGNLNIKVPRVRISIPPSSTSRQVEKGGQRL